MKQVLAIIVFLTSSEISSTVSWGLDKTQVAISKNFAINSNIGHNILVNFIPGAASYYIGQVMSANLNVHAPNGTFANLYTFQTFIKGFVSDILGGATQKTPFNTNKQ